MSNAAASTAPDVGFNELKKFTDRFVRLFPALDAAPRQECTSVLAVSEAVLNWYLVPVVEDTENGAENCALLIKRLINTVIDHVNEIQRRTIHFAFTREAIGGLNATTQQLKIVAAHKEIGASGQGPSPVWLFSVFFEDEDENAETIQIASVA